MNDERRARAVTAMHDAGLDAVILGREANARYVSGARRLWLAGARAFAPGCVLLASGDVHLLSGSDDGIPSEIAFEHLYALTWNAANLMARIAAIPGLAQASTIGVDALTPNMESLLTSTFPGAELRDAQPALNAARRRKLPQELDCMRAATEIAMGALDDVIASAPPRTTERELKARFERRMCERGTTTPAFEGRFGSVFPSDRALRTGDRVVLDAGVLVDGYEGGLTRTIVVDADGVDANPASGLFAALVAAVRPGASGADLWAAWDRSGNRRLARPIAHGVGLGVEPPFVGIDSEPFVEGMTLSITADVDGWVHRDVVVVEPDGASVLVSQP
jgi:Xaa-Pro aminopeptidase